MQWTTFHEPDQIFSEDFSRIGDCAKISFGTKVKIAREYDFFKFYKPYISSRSHPTEEIFYIQTLGGSPYKLTKFEAMLDREYPLPSLNIPHDSSKNR
jgi:hypothetical protein